MLKGWCFDIEADNLYIFSTKIWTIHFKSFCGRELIVNPFRESKEETKKKVIEWVESFGKGSLVITQNGFGFDLWMLWKFLDIPFIKGYKGRDYINKTEVVLIDTLALSQFIDPDRFGGHSLEELAKEYGTYKIDFRERLIELGALEKNAPKGAEFSNYHEIMEEYCDQDVLATIKVFNGLVNKFRTIYSMNPWEYAPCQQHQKDYYLYGAQAISGVKFNKELGLSLVDKISAMMLEIEEKVLPQLPSRSLKKGEQKEYKMPAKPFLTNGELSAHGKKFIEKHGGVLLDNGNYEFYGKEYKLEGGGELDVSVPMEIKDSAELKDFFIEQGWRPTLWNLKRDERGKPEKDARGEVIKTSPKLQEQGKLCPNLEALDGDIPSQIVRYLSLRNRRSVLQGWLDNERLNYDGRLSANITGYTPTFRVKHSTVNY
jgi:hypothetical protein